MRSAGERSITCGRQVRVEGGVSSVRGAGRAAMHACTLTASGWRYDAVRNGVGAGERTMRRVPGATERITSGLPK